MTNNKQDIGGSSTYEYASRLFEHQRQISGFVPVAIRTAE